MITILPDLSEILIYTGEIPITVIIWSLFLGVLIATILSFVIKVKFGIFIRTLLKMNADSPETAVTLEQTGLKSRFFVRRGLKIHSNYQNLMVAITDDGRYYANSHYTSMVPVFKTYMLQRRKRRKSVYKNENEITANTAQKPESAATHTLSDDQINGNQSDVITAVAEDTASNESAMARRLRLEADKQSSQTSQTDNHKTNNAAETEDNGEAADEKSQNEKFQSYVDLTQNTPKQRVKFDIDQAKYYIPPELHDRAASLYFSKPTKLIAVIGALILLAVIATFSETIINFLSELVEGFVESLKPQDKL